MLLGKHFAQFVEESPISVMMRGVVEYAFEADRLDDLFEDTAEAQYTRELRFSTVADLMSEVVFDISPSIGAAYQANIDQMTVSRKSVYNKLNGIERKLGWRPSLEEVRQPDHEPRPNTSPKRYARLTETCWC